METVLKCIDSYLEALEKEVMDILANQKTPMTDKNALIEPLADQKKVLLKAKTDLLAIKNKKYEPGCGMHRHRYV